jgi:integrase
VERCKDDNELVFPIAPVTIQGRFRKYIEKAGVKPIRIHDLRHSFATNLINSGANIVAVSKYLGHANINQTLKTYTHLLKSTDERLVQSVNEMMKNA